MGTNYYLIRTDMPKEEYQKKQETPEIHIGKSSYAGAYCNDCGITLVCEDATQVHDDTISDYQGGWICCPGCGKPTYECEDTSSFTWTMMKHKKLLEELSEHSLQEKVVVDEYGHTYTAEDFMRGFDEKYRIQFQVFSEFC